MGPWPVGKEGESLQRHPYRHGFNLAAFFLQALPASFESGESNTGFLHREHGTGRTATTLGLHFHTRQEALPEGAFS